MEENLYCPVCCHLSAPGAEVCEFCTGQLRKPKEDDPVFLATVDAEAFGFLRENFKREKIEFEVKEQPLPPDGSVYSGKGLLANRDIFVSMADEKRAQKVLSETFTTMEEMEKMPQSRRILIQILSIVGFIVLIYLVIIGADFIVELIKSLW